jgi:hypothetical protein
MPLDDGCRLDQHHGIEDLRPDSVKPHPEQPVGGEEPRAAWARKKAACRKSSSDRRAPGIHRRGAKAAVRRR